MFRTLAIALVAAVPLLSTPVFAQPAAPDPAAGVAARGPMQRIQALHDRLGITAAQQPQWDELVAALRGDAQAMRQDPAAQALRSGQAMGIARLRAMAEVARARADAMQRLLGPAETLYAALSPAQQQIADREIDGMMPGGRRR